MTDAAWQKFGGATVTPNATPSSIQGDLADQLNAAVGAEIAQAFAGTAGLVYTVYFHFKVSTTSTVRVRFSDGGPLNATVDYDLSANTATIVSSNYGGAVKISNAGNGFKQCEFTFTMPAGTLFNAIFPFISNNVFCALGQAELGAYATSYIPTLGAAVTRGAATAEKTGISSLIGQTEGTLFLELDIIAGSPVYQTLMQVYGDDDNRIAIGQDLNNTNVFMFINGSGSSSYQVATVAAGPHKIALAYKNGDSVLYIDGTAAITTTRAISLATSLTTLFLNNLNGNEIGIFKDSQALLFKTRLSNADLAALTA